VSDLDARKYPIGRFHRVALPLAAIARKELIEEIEHAPVALAAAAKGLADAQLDTPYRPGGWTVRQVLHHVPDSHVNAYVRFRLAVTEEAPAITVYREDLWAELPDTKGPVQTSLDLLAALHTRWVAMLRGLPPDAFARTYVHPDMGPVPLDQALALYAWHGRHHLAHIELALGRRTV
jgi:DinB superfamily